MVRRKKLIAYAIVLALAITIIYGCSFTYSFELFFSIPLSHPEAPIDELCGVIIDSIRCISSLTPVALDAKGRIYILGLKKGRSKVLVLNREGKIERIITPYLKNNRPLGRRSPFLSVSPSGNFIWTVKEEGIDVYRVTVHERNGEAKMEWLVRDCDVEHHIAFNAYSEDGAYLVSNVIEIICFRLGRKEPQRIKLSETFHPPYPIFFHDGKYWGIIGLKWLIPNLKFKEQIEKFKIKEDLFGVVTWLPQEGTRLLSVIRLPGLSASKSTVVLQWIDEQGNFYHIRGGYTSLYDSLPSWAREGIWGERIVKILKALRLYDRFRKLEQNVTVWIFSPRGELREVIRLRQVIRPRKGEKLEYGQLVKVDDKGIYWEVEKVNEPREYRIVRIVKKRRWQVWWEALRSWFSPVYPRGKVPQ
ncbi:MAG: hypothetical protein YPKNTGVA_001655 [Candidatus Fervidibacter sp.]